MNDFAHIKTMAAQWRQDNGYADTSGVIVTYQNEVQGWVNELRDPQHWQPGCIATDIDGNQWRASGGNDQDGAAEWQPVAPKLSELYPKFFAKPAEDIKLASTNEEWPIFIPKKLSDDPRYRECQAKEMAARRLEQNRRA